MNGNILILIVDDEPDMLSGTCKILQGIGYQSKAVSNGKDAIEIIKHRKFDLIICDLLMPEIDGLMVLEAACKYAPQTPFIIFTAYATIDRAVTAMKMGASDFLEKPIEVDHLKIVLEKGLRQRKLLNERKNLLDQLEEKYSFDNIIGRSAQMRQVFNIVRSVAASNANVLITGESGTGKELVAQSIHVRSERNTYPFVPVNCGAFPENLFEAELFGYEKGAYTGAAQRKIGLLEYANHGTFFLDEVCEMPSSLQVKLLRVMQDQKLRRLGGNDLIQIDVRIISASNQDLNSALEDNRLREDFYYRLNVININLPPLRERRDDIPLLAEYFLNKFVKSSSKTISGFTEEVLDKLINYNWPGNVRELENVIENIVTFAKDENIVLSDLPKIMNQNDTAVCNNFENVSMLEAKKRAIEDVEKRYLFCLLKKFNGNITKTAAESEMTRRNIHRLLKRYNIDPNLWR